jgi:hypothetical protein
MCRSLGIEGYVSVDLPFSGVCLPVSQPGHGLPCGDAVIIVIVVWWAVDEHFKLFPIIARLAQSRPHNSLLEGFFCLVSTPGQMYAL